MLCSFFSMGSAGPGTALQLTSGSFDATLLGRLGVRGMPDDDLPYGVKIGSFVGRREVQVLTRQETLDLVLASQRPRDQVGDAELLVDGRQRIDPRSGHQEAVELLVGQRVGGYAVRITPSEDVDRRLGQPPQPE